MPWRTTRQIGTKPTYRTAQHKRTRTRLLTELDRDGSGTCAHALYPDHVDSGCIAPTPDIHPGQPLAVAHDRSGTVVLGLAHKACNDRDGALRGNRRSRGIPDPQPTRTNLWWRP